MNGEKFNYHYDAPTPLERREIEDIRKDYEEEKPQTKLEELRSLNKKVKTPPAVVAWIMGIVGILVFGLGLTCVLEWDDWIWGIVCAVVGCAVMGFSYPVYRFILKRNKKKYGQKIVLLSAELLGEEPKQGEDA